MSGEENNSWNEWSMHVLKELERLNGNYDKISSEISKTNQEITRVSGMKFAINDMKAWKERIEEVVNADDLKVMKEFATELSDFKELKEDLKDAKSEVESLKRFKSNTKTVIAVFIFLVTTALTVMGIFIS